MAISHNALLADTSGSIGNMVVVRRNGQTYIRHKAKKHHDAKTSKQLIVRAGLKAANKPVSLFAKYANFSVTKPGQTQRNALMKHIRKEAFAYENKKWILHPEKITLSIGPLDLLESLSADAGENNTINLSWKKNKGNDNAPNDNLYIILFNPLCKNCKVVEASYGLTQRSALQFSFSIPPRWSGQAFYIYVYAISSDSTRISDSKCLSIKAS